ncbi:MAG: ATP-binding protein [Pirellulaceae bacterium]
MPNTDWISNLERSIPSDTKVACQLIREFVAQMQDAGWNEASIFAVHMALEESIMNAIKHGNESDPEKFVQIEARFSVDRFEAEIVDEGLGFEPSEVADPTLDENLELTSGRGVMLIREFMDEVEYLDGGRRIRMTKRVVDER